MSNLIPDQIVDTIRKRGALRTPGLAASFNAAEAEIDAWLAPYCAAGQLISCDVEIAGGKRVKEYRCSTVGGGKLLDTYNVGRPRTKAEPKPDPAFGSRVALKRAIERRFPATQPRPKEAAPVNSSSDKIEVTLRAHGPMVLGELRRHVKSTNLSALLLAGYNRGRFVKLGGEQQRKTLWGVPGQKAASVSATPPAGAAPGAKFIGEILKGVPIPPSARSNGALRTRMEQMAAGDCFQTEYSKEAVRDMGHKLGFNVVTRRDPKNEKVIGVWRVE